MARERMVTRTINVNNIEAMAVNVNTAEVTVKTYSITGEALNTAEALKQVKKIYETDDIKIVAVQSIEVTEELYGVSEIEFLQFAKKLDPTTRKVITEETETE